METLRVIDADTHVDETDDTWAYIPAEDEEFRPTTGFPRNPRPDLPPTRYWVVDGHRKERKIRDDAKSRTTVEQRELLDIEARLRHMDELGTEVQIIYPTLFLVEPATRPEPELTITRSYNRWLAERCALSHGRLRWVCVPPLRNMDEALEELSFAKDHGACGVLKKGDREADHWPSDPYFFPFYEEAERLDLPICVHTGTGTPDFTSSLGIGPGFMRGKAPVINSVFALVQGHIPQQFPKLRFGCVEAGASWVPLVHYSLKRSHETFDRAGATVLKRALGQEKRYEIADDIFKANRIYVTCQVDEDLPMLLDYISEDNLLVGSDYTHQDQSQEHGFVEKLQERVDRGEIPQSAVKKIVYDNPKTFYGL
jgi:predicted TIM-barrel fold metal-dependent hydrolase